MADSSLTLLTPTYRGDLARFAFLRESLERCGVDLPHVAVVDHEDLPRFRDLPHQRNLTLVSTREVLGRAMEARRRARPHRRRHPMHWLGPRPLHGWMIQQLIKLAAPRVIDTPAYLCVDSDTPCLRRFSVADFHGPDGRLHLYETQDDADAEMLGWTYQAMRFLRLSVQGQTLYRYTHAPVPMRVETVRELQSRIGQIHRTDWMDAIDRHHITEYAAYGAFARFGTDMDGLIAAPRPRSLYLWWPDEFESLEHTFATRAANPARRFVTMQSKRPDRVEALHRIMRAFWDGSITDAESQGLSPGPSHNAAQPA